MSYNKDFWNSIQIRAVDPFRGYEGEQVNLTSRVVSLGKDLILFGGSVVHKSGLIVTVQPGKYLKDDVYIEMNQDVDIDFSDPTNYVLNTGQVLDSPTGEYWVVFEYVWAESKPPHYATYKIARRKEEITGWHIVLARVLCGYDSILGDYAITSIDNTVKTDQFILNQGLVIVDPASNNRFYVSGFNYYNKIGELKQFPGGYTREWDDIVNGNFRYDFIALNLDDNLIEIINGNEYDERQDPYEAAPKLHSNEVGLAIAEMYVIDGLTKVLKIYDVRSIINSNNSSSSNAVYVAPHNPPSDKVYVGPFVYINTDGIRPIKFLGGNSPSFAPIDNLGNERYDYLCIDDFGSLIIEKGQEVVKSENNDPYQLCPNIPSYAQGLAIIRIDEVTLPVITQEDIFDGSESLNKGGGSGNPNSFIQLVKDDWDGINNRWTFNFVPNFSNPYIVIQDGIVLKLGYGFTLEGDRTLVFDVPPKKYTLFYGLEMFVEDDTYVSGAIQHVKTDWDGQQQDWILPFSIDTNLPVQVVSDNLFLEPGIDYQIPEPNKIHFVDPPKKFTYVIAYPKIQVVLSDSAVAGYKEALKTDWNGTDTTWNLPYIIDQNVPNLVVQDSLVLEEGVDFNFTGPNTIEFVNPPQKFTKIISYVITAAPTVKVVYDQVIFTKADIDPNTKVLNIGLAYDTGFHQLTVYVDRNYLFDGVDYTENDSYSIKFTDDVYNTLITDTSRITIKIPKLRSF